MGWGEQVKVLFGFVRGYDFCNVRRKKLLQASVSSVLKCGFGADVLKASRPALTACDFVNHAGRSVHEWEEPPRLGLSF